MDTDLKPRMRPPTDEEDTSKDPVSSQLPELEEDPFKPDEQPAGPTVSKKRGGKKGLKVFLLILLMLVLLGGTAYGVYYWQDQKVKDANARVTELNNEVQTLQGQVDELEAANKEAEQEVAADTAADTDTAVIAAAQASCQATLDPATSKALVFTIGTTGTAKKKVVYSTDKGFASLTATCGTVATPGASQTYYLKNVNGSWVVVYRGATADAATIKLYGIPTAFN